jgi:serine/threonine-protein kinase SRPK3
LVRHDGKPLDKSLPKQLVGATKWDKWVDEDKEDLRVIDFGEGFIKGAEPAKLAQPGPMRVPETIFAEPFDHRVDLWCAGCVVRDAPPILQKIDINTRRFIRSSLEQFRLVA